MNVQSAPAYSFSSKISQKAHTPTPGPSDYNPTDYTRKNPPVFKIAKPSSQKNLQSTPGPSTYEPIGSSGKSPSQTISKSSRFFKATQNQTPGPGSYEIRALSIEGPKYTFPKNSSKPVNKDSPGPGLYNNTLNGFTSKEKAPAFKIGTESRDKTAKSPAPGPGTYNPDSQETGPKWKFGLQSKERFLKSQQPGPGSYNIPSFSSKGITMVGRSNQCQNNDNPGPGSYNPVTVRPKSPTWKLGTSARAEFKLTKTPSPGPGTYSTALTGNRSAAVFGTASRSLLSEKESTPGPAEYGTASNRTGPAYTLRPKTANHKIERQKTPGPGHYTIEEPDKKGWTVGKEAKHYKMDERSRLIPGPGQYESLNSSKGPFWVFGTASKGNKARSITPGPGNYESMSTVGNLPSYAKASKI